MRKKWIARAYLAIRQLEKGTNNEGHEENKDGARLEAQVWLIKVAIQHKKANREAMCAGKLEDDTYGPKKWYTELIQEMKEARYEIEDLRTRKALSDWKRKTQGDIKDLSNWAKSRGAGATPTIEKEGVPANSLDEACQYIIDQWEDLWTKQEEKYGDKLRAICEQIAST